MEKFNKFERLLANTLSYMPGLKDTAKRTYQFINYHLYKKDFYFKCKYPINQVSNYDKETFFGYYDKSPENIGGRLLIYQRTTQNTANKPSCKYPVDIVLKDDIGKTEQVIASSLAYNWQQGTKLQWINKDKFIFNFFDKGENRYKSKIYNIKSHDIQVLDLPIYDCFQEKYALTLNFIRLNRLRPDYGYRCVDQEINYNKNTDDGIYRINMPDNKFELILSLQEVINFGFKKTMNNAKHKFNHIMISPDGKKFIFMHRWFASSGKRYDRLFVSNNDGSGLKLVADDGMVSHCCWNGNREVIGYLRNGSYGDSFYKINVESGKVELLSEKLLKFSDGHPSVYGNYMLFDSYPDRSRFKHLYIYNMLTDEIVEIGEFYESLRFFNETRCDLHPKWGVDGKKIFIDSVHEGKRKLFEINIDL